MGTLKACISLCFLVTNRVHEHMSACLIDQIVVPEVVKTRATGLTELDMFHVGFRYQLAVIVLPGTKQLVGIFRPPSSSIVGFSSATSNI